MPIALDTLAKVTLAPVLLAQARKVRRSALILPEAAGARAGGPADHPPDHPRAGAARQRLLILGDSSAAGVGAVRQEQALSGGLARLLPQVAWRLEARTGATTASAFGALDTLNGAQFDCVLVVLGVNDVTHMVPQRRLLAQRHALYHRLISGHCAKRIVVSGLPPMGAFPLLPQPLAWVLGRQAARFDAALADQAARMGHSYLRHHARFDVGLMAADGFHPGPVAYQLWAERLAPLLFPQYSP